LTEALHDVHRIARSRGARLPATGSDDDEPADAEIQTSAGQ
jgi:hypothetical protein